MSTKPEVELRVYSGTGADDEISIYSGSEFVASQKLPSGKSRGSVENFIVDFKDMPFDTVVTHVEMKGRRSALEAPRRVRKGDTLRLYIKVRWV